ncbi:aminotransferase, partial [Rhizobium leguminosarum]|nr:aminotransferase [Rhizobium ruizarguesonis]
ADLGGHAVGTQFAIFTYKDFDDPARREELIKIAIDCWADVADPDDYDPYAWARAVPPVSPIIHIKQSLMDKGGHRPFTAEFN